LKEVKRWQEKKFIATSGEGKERMKPRLIAIVGPNASGKSALGITLARRFGGEIVSADSRQVFRGMDIGTGKVHGVHQVDMATTIRVFDRDFTLIPLKSEGVLHWMLDVVEPDEPFSVAEYQGLAFNVINQIISRNRRLFIVGGTGLYIRAVTEGLHFPGVPCQDELRAQLEEKSVNELRSLILARDPDAEKIVDLKNKRRMVRALEVLTVTGGTLGAMREKREVPFDSFMLGLKIPRDILCRKIRDRLTRRLDNGMVTEVERLLRQGVSGVRMESFGLEYRFIYRYLQGKLTYDQMDESLYHAICRFAKRQMTWFRKYGTVHWIISEAEAIESSETILRD
jgi:tRNA dimethylallyltransferase